MPDSLAHLLDPCLRDAASKLYDDAFADGYRNGHAIASAFAIDHGNGYHASDAKRATSDPDRKCGICNPHPLLNAIVLSVRPSNGNQPDA